MEQWPPRLAELADSLGVATQFWDWKGRLTHVSAETIVGILAGMDVDASTSEAVDAALDDLRVRPWRRALPPCVVLEQGSGTNIFVHVDHGASAVLTVRLEDGGADEVGNLSPLCRSEFRDVLVDATRHVLTLL